MAKEWCPVCGDVKACLHRPDEVIVAAWRREMANAERRRAS